MNPNNVDSTGSARSNNSQKTTKKVTAKKVTKRTPKAKKGKNWVELGDLLLDYSHSETEHDLDAPTFVISLAAQMAGMHPQTLRQYDRLGLVQPQRTRGGGRRYSPRDLAKLRYVQKLSQELGVNLTGIQLVLELNDKVNALEAEIQELRQEIRAQTLVKDRVFMADGSGKVLQRATSLRVREADEREEFSEATPQDVNDEANKRVEKKEVKELPGRSLQDTGGSELVVWGETHSISSRLMALMKSILRRNNSK